MKNQDVREAAILEIYEIADELSKEKDSPYFKIWKICNDALKQIEPEVIPQKDIVVYFEELAKKHNVQVEDLNLHISDKRLYVQKYTDGAMNKFKLLEMLDLKSQ
jgi:hypothetical protein